MKVYAIIECHYDDYYPNHIVLDGSAYLYEEDAKQALKEKQESQGNHLFVMRAFNVIDRPKTSVTVLSSRMGFVCLSGRNMIDEEDSQIMIGYDDIHKLIEILSTAQECQKKHIPAKWTYQLSQEKPKHPIYEKAEQVIEADKEQNCKAIEMLDKSEN